MGHRSTEKFCLRWNDFESNISVAFRELREEQDFFDVTLACDDDDHVEAHRVILSACSPFFRSVLRRTKHAHPLLYLKGVKHADLVSVLNFMYHGEVNVAQEELNSFLAVAEELKVKGLTQQNGGQTDDRTGGGGGSGSGGGSAGGGGSSGNLTSSRVRGREQPLSSAPSDRSSSADGGAPSAKRSRTMSSAVPSTPISAPASAAVPLANSKLGSDNCSSYDDDIQEVVPVKSEPIMAANDAHALVAPSLADDYSGGGGQLVSDEYGEDYADYEGGGGYDGDGSYDGSGLDNSLAGGGASADGNKGRTR
jgi:hypothetical protein